MKIQQHKEMICEYKKRLYESLCKMGNYDWFSAVATQGVVERRCLDLLVQEGLLEKRVYETTWWRLLSPRDILKKKIGR